MDHNPSNDGINCLLYIGTEKWFSAAVITFVVLAVLAFFIPNFYNITFQPLLGYAAFLAIISLMISFLYGILQEDGAENVKKSNWKRDEKYDNDEYMYRRRDRR